MAPFSLRLSAAYFWMALFAPSEKFGVTSMCVTM